MFRQAGGRAIKRHTALSRPHLRLREIAPGDLVHFVSLRARSLRPMSVRALCDSLRSFPRFLHFEGRCPKRLDLAIPTMHAWNRAELPTVIEAEQLRRFLASFDKSTAMGRRDYAMARCMCDLGLRVNEVAQLCLEHLDWRKGTLKLPQNKQRRELQLPLPGQLAPQFRVNVRPVGQKLIRFHWRGRRGHQLLNQLLLA